MSYTGNPGKERPLGHLTGPRLLAAPDDTKRRIAACMRGFSPPDAGHGADSQTAHSVEVPWGDPLDPWAIRFFIVDIVGGEDLGRFEKIAWEAPLVMDGTLIWFRHSKFGVRAQPYGLGSEGEAVRVVEECLRRMGKALPVVRRDLIDPLITETVAKGGFTVPNKFAYLLEMFEHFRSLSKETSARAQVTRPAHFSFKNGSSITFPALQVAQQAEFEAVGALFALFSLLEHLLIIGLTFTNYDPETEPFDGILRLSWGDKFKRVVGFDRREDKIIYDLLMSLADGNRNPAAHGGVERGIANLNVHLDGYGAVPTGINAGSTGPDYSFKPILAEDVFPFSAFEANRRSIDGWSAVDQVLGWMRSGPLAYAYTYGASQLPVWFDAESRRQLMEAAGDGDLEGFVRRRAWMVDQAANMDW